ncbi:MAG: GntR family transcriptional regulator [Clostridiales bacterium]|nr:GntR family transcriptional regulator [Clostridiales bacterium]
MGTPMYMRIQQYIRLQIESGEWPVDSPVPTESELMEKFNVSRITVTTALRELVKEGLIYRIQGKGTYVAEQTKTPDIFDIMQMFGVANSLESIRLPGEHRVNGFRLEYPDEEAAEILKLDSDQKTFIVNRNKYVNDIPIVAEKVYYPDYIFSGVPQEKLETSHISALLKDLGIETGKSVSYIEPVLCDAEIAAQLELKKGMPIFKISLEVYDKKDNVIALIEMFNYGKQRYIMNT